MRKLFGQLSLSDVYEECKGLLDSDKPRFLALLESNPDLSDFIPKSFYDAFYLNLGRNREYPLEGFISALILQKIFSVPSDSLLILFLSLSSELRDFCGFSKVPDASKFTRFKQSFVDELTRMFDSLVDYTEPICREIDKNLADTLIFDTSGIESYVTENNCKFTDSLIKKLKTAYKNKPEVDPYKMAYGLMPPSASADSSIKQMYTNGHFCYARKFGILTNGLGIVRHIAFLDEDFKAAHPELVTRKKSDSPDEDKSIGDSSSLQPVLHDFYAKHPVFRFSTFLGDAAFDKGDHYSFLKDTCRFEKILIPINPRNSSVLPSVGYNEFGYPLCPNNDSLVMKYSGITKENGRTSRLKWICPKFSKGRCNCDSPCSNAKFGRTAYTFEAQSFRLFPGIQRESEQWQTLYKDRTAIERTINHLKTNMCTAYRKSRDSLTMKADLLLASVAQLLTVVLAHRLKHPQLLRSLKPLFAA